MTSADRNDLVPAQEKLEWVTPKISLMEADKTAGAKSKLESLEHTFQAPWGGPDGQRNEGPS